MTLSLLALVVAQTGTLDLTAQKELQVPVTMKMRAQRMPLALAEIGKTGGVKLSSGPEFENEPLIVVVNKVSLASLMDQTAKAAGGEWVKTGEEFRLMRPSALADKFRAQERQWIQNTLRLASLHPTAGSLDARIHAELFRLVTPEFVNKLSPLDRVVFSDKPSAWQVPAGAIGRELLQLGVQKWRADKAASVAPKKATALEEEEEYPAELSEFPPDALRVVTYWESPYWLCVDFPSPRFFYAPETGEKTTARAFPEYVNFGTHYIPLHAEDSDEHVIVLADKNKSVVVDARHDGFINLLNLLYEDRPIAKVANPDFEKMVMRPDEHDPLAYAVSDYFFTLAGDQKANLVAVPTDDFFEIPENAGDVEVDLSFAGFTERLNDSKTMTITKGGTFLRVEPTWKIRGGWARLNRIALGKLLDQKQQSVVVPLGAYAEFASSIPDFSANIVTQYGEAVGFFSLFASVDYFELRFYHSLSLPQRKAMLEGQPLRFSELSPPQRLATQRMISRSGGFGGDDHSETPTGLAPGIPREVSDYLEITDILTSEFERSIEFSASNRNHTVVAFADYNGYPAKRSQLSSALLAYERHQMETSDRPIENGVLPNFDKYFLGQELNYDIEFLLTPNLKRTIGLTDTQFSQKVYRYDELPADFRASAETVRDRIRNRRNRP